MDSNKGLDCVNLSQIVIEEIYKLIDDRGMKPGDKFPVDGILIKLWNVSRSTLREAFHILGNQGVVISKQGKGRFLRNVPVEANLYDGLMSKLVARYSLLDLYEVRQGLEMKAMDLVVKNATDKELLFIEASYKDMCRTFKENNNTKGENRLHRQYVSVSHNDYLIHLLNDLIDVTNSLMNQIFFYMARMHRIDEYERDHKEIIDALIRRNSIKAQKAMRDHLQKTIEIIVTK